LWLTCICRQGAYDPRMGAEMLQVSFPFRTLG
jgi:hypothetical protein